MLRRAEGGRISRARYVLFVLIEIARHCTRGVEPLLSLYIHGERDTTQFSMLLYIGRETEVFQFLSGESVIRDVLF